MSAARIVTDVGVVRLTNHELADHERSRLSRCELTPSRECGRAVLLEDIAAVKVAVIVEVIVDRGMGGGKLLEGFQGRGTLRVNNDRNGEPVGGKNFFYIRYLNRGCAGSLQRTRLSGNFPC